VRTGAARGLGGCPEEVAVPALLGATTDAHLDVRKAAVIALGGWTRRPDVREALDVATKDSDADVRGYARRQLARSRS
jgi:HEAT repeat protein